MCLLIGVMAAGQERYPVEGEVRQDGSRGPVYRILRFGHDDPLTEDKRLRLQALGVRIIRKIGRDSDKTSYVGAIDMTRDLYGKPPPYAKLVESESIISRDTVIASDLSVCRTDSESGETGSSRNSGDKDAGAEPRIHVLVAAYEADLFQAEARRLRLTPYGASTWQGLLTKTEVLALAKEPGVMRVTCSPMFIEHNEHARAVVNNAGAAVNPNLGVGVFENQGVLLGHNAFSNPGNMNVNSVGGSNASSHGTAVASIAAGREAADANPIQRGHGPGAKVLVYRPQWCRDLQIDAPPMPVADLTAAGDVTNHSYACVECDVANCDPADYYTDDEEVDNYIHNTEWQPWVFSAGNVNSTLPGKIENPAKNPLTVGSIDVFKAGTTSPCDPEAGNCVVSGLSAGGLTSNGRMKPDVMAPGCYRNVETNGIINAEAMSTANVSSNDSYQHLMSCGTSYAAPAVAGIILQLKSRNLENLVEDCNKACKGIANEAACLQTCNAGSGEAYLASSYKAMIVHGATDLGGDPGPDPLHGYGIVNATESLDLLGQGKIRELDFDITAAPKHYCVDTKAGDTLRIVLAWDDEASSPCIDPELSCPSDGYFPLVHDLDLTAQRGSGTPLLPYTLTGGVVTKAADHLNNVELLHVAGASGGVYKVSVTPFGGITDTQRASLVASHPLEACGTSEPGIPEAPDDTHEIWEGVELPEELERWAVREELFCKLTGTCKPCKKQKCRNKFPLIGGLLCKKFGHCPSCRETIATYCPAYKSKVERRFKGIKVIDSQGRQVSKAHWWFGRTHLYVPGRSASDERYVILD
ncbi:MAG: S8 family serine peptidase [Pseudomonadota bacterium]